MTLRRCRQERAWQFEVPAGLAADAGWPRVGVSLLAAAATLAAPAWGWALLPAGLLSLSGQRPVRALRVHPDPACWQARLSGGWQAVSLRRAQAHKGYMALSFEPATRDCVTNSKISCTVWATNLAPDHWRRLRVIARVAGCKAAYRRGAS